MSHSISADAARLALENHPHWFSSNPDRAWAEKFFLLYSPVWMALMGIMMITGWVETFSDTALLLHGIFVAAPMFVIPAFLRKGKNPGNSWLNSYWFKVNVYLFLFGFFGNYFGSEYFFDVLGMVYNLQQVSTTLDATLLGKDEQTVPLIMYFYTHAYFVTYHTTAIIALRRIMTSNLPLRTLLFMPACLVIGYFWAWMETKAMANPLMESTFYYTNMEAMLAYGSLIYATYFIGSFPIYYFMDEKQDKPWDIWKVAAAGLSASMIVFYLLDACAYWVGTIGV